ncbi:hypothetical protein HDR58_10555 [bacterium]|nr:hypothetical protein [bacterium]
MEGFIHKIWVVLFAFMIFGMLAWVPVGKYQKSYMDAYHAAKNKPQEHVDQAYNYADYVENGGAPNSYQLTPQDYYKKYKIRRRNVQKTTKRKPYYIRDKHNPKILHPYRG